MVIKRYKFKDVIKQLLNALEQGAGFVIINKYSKTADELNFAFNSYDAGLIYSDEQFEPLQYESYQIRDVYETMVLLSKGKQQLFPFINEYGEIDNEKIDIGKSVNERLLLQSLIERLPNTDWYYDYSDDFNVRRRGEEEQYRLADDLLALAHTGQREKGALQLLNTYIGDAPLSQNLKKAFSSVNVVEESLLFFKKQYYAAGFGSLYTDALATLIRQGVPDITHSFAKGMFGDRLDGKLHFYRSRQSGFYRLDYFDLSLTKAGDDYSFTGRFHINKNAGDDEYMRKEKGPEFTLRKAYNFLCGRPVQIGTYFNETGDSYEAWQKINYRKKQSDGIYAPDETHIPTSGDSVVKKILRTFPFEENKSRKKLRRTVEIISEGGLAPTTLVNEAGDKKKVHVSMNLPYRSLHLYSQYRVNARFMELYKDKFMGFEAAQRLDKMYPHSRQTNYPFDSDNPSVNKPTTVQKTHKIRIHR